MTTSERILIVDDLARTRQSLKALLSTWPGTAALQEAVDGGEAVDLAETWSPDIILMDVCMPGMNGLEATRAIKARKPAAKIVAMSMNADYEAEALAAGADAFVEKGRLASILLQVLDALAAA